MTWTGTALPSTDNTDRFVHLNRPPIAAAVDGKALAFYSYSADRCSVRLGALLEHCAEVFGGSQS
jgi:hypothetical protein